MLQEVEVLYHNCIKISGEKTVYIDPFGVQKNYNDADMIFITHSHYDHFSPEDIEKVRNNKTVIVVTEDLLEKTAELGFDKIITVKPNENYNIENIEISTVRAYNVNKKFHPKENNWVGYILSMNNKKYYIAGDTDNTEDAQKVECDIAFVPVGGTYTMTASEAAEFINIIKPKIAVPVHYASIVGEKEDGKKFASLVSQDIKCVEF